MALSLVFNINDKATPQVKKLRNELGKLDTSVNKTSKTFLGFDTSLVKAAGGFVVLDKAIDGAKLFIKTADTMTLLNSRLNLVTKSTLELETAQKALFNISQSTRSQLEGTVDLYTRIARSTKDYNVAQSELLGITKTINQALIVSGGSAASAQAAIVQLGQAFSADFQSVGQELGSLREQAPRVYQALLEGTGKTSKEFKKLAEDGKLSTEIIINALKSQSDAVAGEFSQIVTTVDQSSVQASNSLGDIVGGINEIVDITGSLAENITGFSKSLTANRQEIISFAVTTSAVIGKFADGFSLAFDTIGSLAVGIVASVNTLVYGAIRPITELALSASKALNSIGLSSDESLEKTRKLAEFVDTEYKKALNGFSFAVDNTETSLRNFSKTIEERILDSEIESEIKEWNKELVKMSENAKKAADSTNKIKPFSFNGDTSTLDKYASDLDKIKIDFENFSKTRSQIEKDELQERFDANQEFIMNNVAAYQGYTNEMAKLDKQITEEHKQSQIQKLEDAGGFLNGTKVGLIELGEQSKDSFSTGQKSVESFSSNSANAIINFAESGKGSFGDFTRSVINDLIRIQIQQQAAGFLSSAISAGISAFSGPSLGSNTSTLGEFNLLTRSANGNIFSGGNLQKFAKGGTFTNSIVSSPTVFPMANGGTGLMGEAGPEAVVPLDRDSSGKLGINASGLGGGSNVNIVINEGGKDKAQVSSTTDDAGNVQVIVDLVEKQLVSGANQGTGDFANTIESLYGLQRGR